MKKTILLLFVLSSFCFTISLQANEIRAGAISLRQASGSSLTVAATIYLVIESHADIENLDFCWGDGECTNFPTLSGSVNAVQGLKYYNFTTTHTYAAMQSYTATISHCCYDQDITNISNGGGTNFEIETTIVLGMEENTTPTFSFPLIGIGTPTSSLSVLGADADAEGDTYSNQLCPPENVSDFSNIEYPGSTLALNMNGTGIIVWANPGFNGNYILQVCTEETRNGSLISSSKRIIGFTVDQSLSATALSNIEISLSPNPVMDGIVHLENKGSTDLNGSNLLIYNVLGSVELSENWDGVEEASLSVAHLPKGMYVVIILLENGNRFYKQIVIQ